MSWGAGGRAVDEMLHVAAVSDSRRHAATRRAAALTIADQLGTDCRDVLEACGLAQPAHVTPGIVAVRLKALLADTDSAKDEGGEG